MMKRLASGVAAVTLIVGGMAFIGAFGAGASGTPTITITPNTGLTDMQQVQITGTGFTPNLTIGSTIALECLATATDTTGCDTTNYALVTSDANGDVSFPFTVHTGTIGNGTCGTSATDATCIISIAMTNVTSRLLTGGTITFSSGSATTTTTTTTPTTTTTTTTTVPPTTTTTVPPTTTTTTTVPSTTTTTTTVPPTPTVQVSPSTGLTNGASVTVTGSGFKAGDSVYAVECLATATSSAGCDIATATGLTAEAGGSNPSATFKVVTGTVGTGTCGTSSSNLSKCIIEVANLAATDVGFAPITFKAPSVIAPAPRATKTTGTAVPGYIEVVTVWGSHFTAVSRVSGPVGATISVKSVTASKLTLKIKEAANAKKGSYTLTIHFKSGKTATVVVHNGPYVGLGIKF